LSIRSSFKGEGFERDKFYAAASARLRNELLQHHQERFVIVIVFEERRIVVGVIVIVFEVQHRFQMRLNAPAGHIPRPPPINSPVSDGSFTLRHLPGILKNHASSHATGSPCAALAVGEGLDTLNRSWGCLCGTRLFGLDANQTCSLLHFLR
jgi:hypothetical protein